MAMHQQVETALILAPDAIARAAADYATAPEQRWMLRQPRSVRRSYWRDVMRHGSHQRDREIWMLRQPDAVRESFIAQVLAPGPPEGTGADRADPMPPSLASKKPSVAWPRALR